MRKKEKPEQEQEGSAVDANQDPTHVNTTESCTDNAPTNKTDTLEVVVEQSSIEPAPLAHIKSNGPSTAVCVFLKTNAELTGNKLETALKQCEDNLAERSVYLFSFIEVVWMSPLFSC
jgi:hypothetical protein